MLDLAGVDIGHRVLDVAAGTGEQTLNASSSGSLDGATMPYRPRSSTTACKALHCSAVA